MTSASMMGCSMIYLDTCPFAQDWNKRCSLMSGERFTMSLFWNSQNLLILHLSCQGAEKQFFSYFAYYSGTDLMMKFPRQVSILSSFTSTFLLKVLKMQSMEFSVLLRTWKVCSVRSPIKICPKSMRLSRQPSLFRMSTDYSTKIPLSWHLAPLENDKVSQKLPTFLLLSFSSTLLLSPVSTLTSFVMRLIFAFWLISHLTLPPLLPQFFTGTAAKLSLRIMSLPKFQTLGIVNFSLGGKAFNVTSSLKLLPHMKI